MFREQYEEYINLYQNNNSLGFLALFLREFAFLLLIAVVKSSPDFPQRFDVEFSDREDQTGEIIHRARCGFVDRKDLDQAF